MKTREKLINASDKSVKTIEHINKNHGKNESHQQIMNMNKHVRINEHSEKTHIHEHHGNVDEHRCEKSDEHL